MYATNREADSSKRWDSLSGGGAPYSMLDYGSSVRQFSMHVCLHSYGQCAACGGHRSRITLEYMHAQVQPNGLHYVQSSIP